MKGRKPKPENVIPFRGEGPGAGSDAYQAAIQQRVNQLRPRWMKGAELRREWNRVATMLAQPTIDRLRAHFVDVIAEYCRLCVRLREHYAAFPTLDAEYYDKSGGRYGDQRKTDPRVAQRNETWRQWNSLRMSLGLDPASERNLMPGQGTLFDDPSEEYFA